MAARKSEDIERLLENARLTRENELLRERLDEVRAEMQDLRSQVNRLQDALIAKEAPMAYLDQKTPEPPSEWVEEHKRNLEAFRRFATDPGDQPLFDSVDEMISSLSKAAGMQPGPVHDSQES